MCEFGQCRAEAGRDHLHRRPFARIRSIGKPLRDLNSKIYLAFRATNESAPAARGDGFRLATSDDVAIVDADDYQETGAPEEAYNALVQTGGDFAFGGCGDLKIIARLKQLT